MLRFLLVFLLSSIAVPVLAAPSSQHLGSLSTDKGISGFQKIIERRCTGCHSRDRIDQALAEREDIEAILARMTGKGATLSPAEKELLTAWWQDDRFAEVNRVIQLRCTGCHSRERIDQALAEGRDLDAIQQKMIRFGANLSAREQNVLGVFSGQALK